MADTLTVHYAFTLIGVGGSRDTWGAKVNANLVAIDQRLYDLAGTIPSVAALMPKAGGDFVAAPTVGGAGVVPHFAAAGMTSGRIYVAAASGADPTSQAGDAWLGY